MLSNMGRLPSLLLAGLLLCAELRAAGAESSKVDLFFMHICKEKFGPYVLPDMVEFALEMINERDDLLADYRLLAMHAFVPGQSLGLSIKAFIDQVSSPPRKLLILGPTFSSQAKVLAVTTQYYNLVQMGYSTTSPALSNVDVYPFLVRSMESSVLFNAAIAAILDHFEWKKVGILLEEAEFTTPTRNLLVKLLNEKNITIVSTPTFIDDPTSQMKQIKASGCRIIIAFTNHVGGHVRPFCRAYREGLYGRGYQWIHWSVRYGFESQLTDPQPADDCTEAEINEAMKYVISFAPQKPSADFKKNVKGFSGYTSVETLVMYKTFLSRTGRQQARNNLFEYGFDAVFAIALALDATLRHPNVLRVTTNETVVHANLTRVLYEAMLNVQFVGLTGDVRFEKNGDRGSGVIAVQGPKETRIAVYEDNALQWPNKTAVIFPGGYPPQDSVTFIKQLVRVNSALFLAIVLLTVICIFFCLICVAFNVYHRKTRFIKMSSPRINYIIAYGCLCCYFAILLIGVDSHMVANNDAICAVRVWALVCGFTLAFGSMFAKTWRVHAILTNKDAKSKIIKDKMLAGIVLCVLLVDITVLIFWQIFDPLAWTTVQLARKDYSDKDAIVYVPEVRSCSCKNASYWLGAFYAFKALLMIFGIFFAWETRHVRIDALNDSKEIGMCVYNVMILSVVCVILTNFLPPESVNVTYAIISFSILICATTTLMLVFGVKMYQIYGRGSKIEDASALPFAATLKQGRKTGNETEAPHSSVHVNYQADDDDAKPPPSQMTRMTVPTGDPYRA